VKDYSVIGIPTFFLLAKNNTILARPVSVQHIDSLIEFSK